MVKKAIPDLNQLSKENLSNNDLLLITDLSDKQTKNIKVSEFQDYTISKLDYLLTGSFTGSFSGKLYGSTLTSSFSNLTDLSKSSSFLLFNGDVNGTSSYSISSSKSTFSISSSQSNTSSHALSSSYSDVTLHAIKSSSIQSLKSSVSLYSESSLLSKTSSFLNYYGQNNGTAHSSSFSEICNLSSVADNIIDKASSIVRFAKQANESNFSRNSNIAITSSMSINSKTADAALNRLFSSLEFRISTDATNKTINITPISWKNIRNIAAGTIGNLFTDFYVTFKKKPPFAIERQDEASNRSTVTVGSFQLGADNLIRNIQPRSYNPVPIFTSYVFPCGVDGYVIRFVNCTLYGVMQKLTGWGSFTSVFDSAVRARQTAVSNNQGAVYWAKQLNGVVVSSQTFCNTVDFLNMGPPNTLSQFETFVTSRFSRKILRNSGPVAGFPLESSILNLLFNWIKIGPNFEDDVIYNIVTSIANSSGSNYNLLLLESDKYYPQFSGRQIALMQGETFYPNSLHFPKTGSSISASVGNSNYLCYNTSSKDYLCVADSKILYITASSIHNYTGSSNYGNNLYLNELQSKLPIWNEYKTNLTNCSKISHISNNRYILINNVNYNLQNAGEAASGMPIYIIPDITAQATSEIQSNNVAGGMAKSTNIILGYNGGLEGIPKQQILPNKYIGNYRVVNIDKTIFKTIKVLDSKRAIVAGDNGVIVYSNNIDNNSPSWIRVDPLSPGQPIDSAYLRLSTEYLVEINDIYTIYPSSIESVIVCGKDNSGRASMITCKVPRNNDLIIANWQWQGVQGLFSHDTLDVDDNGNLLPTQIGSSSFKAVFKDTDNVIAVGYSTFPTSSYYRYATDKEVYPYQIGSYNTSSIINAIGRIENNMYIFGGKNTLDLYEIIS